MTLRTYDATVLNSIAADPTVAESMGWDGGEPMTFDKFAADPVHFILMDNGVDAGTIFEWRGPRIWEVHTMSLPSCRGENVFKVGLAIWREMFRDHADIIWTQCPISNLPARGISRKIGGRSMGFGESHLVGQVEYFRFDRDDWLARFGE